MDKKEDPIFEGIKLETPNTKLKNKFTNLKADESEKIQNQNFYENIEELAIQQRMSTINEIIIEQSDRQAQVDQQSILEKSELNQIHHQNNILIINSLNNSISLQKIQSQNEINDKDLYAQNILQNQNQTVKRNFDRQYSNVNLTVDGKLKIAQELKTEITKMKNSGPNDLEFYALKSERSHNQNAMNHLQQKQNRLEHKLDKIQDLGKSQETEQDGDFVSFAGNKNKNGNIRNYQQSESSTNNLMYSQSVKINDVESTIHNINNQSMMHSDAQSYQQIFDQKMIDKMIWEESEKFFKNAPDQDYEILKKFKEMKLKQSMKRGAQEKTEEKKKESAYNSIGILKGVNVFQNDQQNTNMLDESINFSNLESSINNPSNFNDITSNKDFLLIQKHLNQYQSHLKQKNNAQEKGQSASKAQQKTDNEGLIQNQDQILKNEGNNNLHKINTEPIQKIDFTNQHEHLQFQSFQLQNQQSVNDIKPNISPISQNLVEANESSKWLQQNASDQPTHILNQLENSKKQNEELKLTNEKSDNNYPTLEDYFKQMSNNKMNHVDQQEALNQMLQKENESPLSKINLTNKVDIEEERLMNQVQIQLQEQQLDLQLNAASNNPVNIKDFLQIYNNIGSGLKFENKNNQDDSQHIEGIQKNSSLLKNQIDLNNKQFSASQNENEKMNPKNIGQKQMSGVQTQTDQKSESVINQYNQFNQYIITNNNDINKLINNRQPNSNFILDQSNHRAPGTAGVSQRGKKEMQNSLWNGLSKYDEFENNGGGPVSELIGFSNQNEPSMYNLHVERQNTIQINNIHLQNGTDEKIGNQIDNFDNNFATIKNKIEYLNANKQNNYQSEVQKDQFDLQYQQSINGTSNSINLHKPPAYSRQNINSAFPNKNQGFAFNQDHNQIKQEYKGVYANDNKNNSEIYSQDQDFNQSKNGFLNKQMNKFQGISIQISDTNRKQHRHVNQSSALINTPDGMLSPNQEMMIKKQRNHTVIQKHPVQSKIKKDQSQDSQLKSFMRSQSLRNQLESPIKSSNRQKHLQPFVFHQDFNINIQENDVEVGVGKSILDLIALKSINGLSIREDSFMDTDFDKNESNDDCQNQVGNGIKLDTVKDQFNIDISQKSINPSNFYQRLREFKKITQFYRKFKEKQKSYFTNYADKKKITQKYFSANFINKYQKKSNQEKIKIRLPTNVILRIIQNLSFMESQKLMCVNKYIYNMIRYNPEFDGQWIIKSFQHQLSKSGYSGLRNNNLRKIDIQLRSMHFQSQSILKDSIDHQWYYFKVWLNFAFIFTFVIMPVFLIVNEEYSLKLPLFILMLPITFCWALLLFLIYQIQIQVQKYHTIVTNIHKYNQSYKQNYIMQNMGNPNGRITKFCTKYTIEEFTDRFLKYLIISLFFLYFGIFVKVYILNILAQYTSNLQIQAFSAQYGWVSASVISFAPFFMLYLREIISQSILSQNHILNNQNLLQNLIKTNQEKQNKISKSPNMIQNKERHQQFENLSFQDFILNHRQKSVFMDYLGVLMNILTIPGGIFTFYFLTAKRLDGGNQISFFILFIPIWIAILPLFAFIVLKGLAAENTRVNKCEKVSISILIPIGFLASLILLVFYIDRQDAFKLSIQSDNFSDFKFLKIVFMPHFFSVICLYLYLRCLIKPARVQNLQPRQEQLQD